MTSKWAKRRKELKESQIEEIKPPAVEAPAMSDEELMALLDDATNTKTIVTVEEALRQDEPVSKEPVATTPEVVNEAYSVIFNPDIKKFQLVTISFNLGRGTSTITKVEDFADSQAVVMYKINGIFANKLIRRGKS